MMIKAAELKVNQPNSVSSHRSLHLPLTPIASLAGLQALRLVRKAKVWMSEKRCPWSWTSARLNLAKWTNSNARCHGCLLLPGQSMTRLQHVCAGQAAGKCSCSPLPSSRLGQGKSHRRTGAVQAAKQFLLYKARPDTCLLPYTLPGVTPGLCRSAEV